MAAHRGLGVLLVAVAVGLVVGSILGDLLGQLVGSAWLRDVLTRGPSIGVTPPTTLDLRLLSLTFGVVLKVNLVGAIGAVVALVAVRR